jgi:hypothetical protein
MLRSAKQSLILLVSAIAMSGLVAVSVAEATAPPRVNFDRVIQQLRAGTNYLEVATKVDLRVVGMGDIAALESVVGECRSTADAVARNGGTWTPYDRYVTTLKKDNVHARDVYFNTDLIDAASNLRVVWHRAERSLRKFDDLAHVAEE